MADQTITTPATMSKTERLDHSRTFRCVGSFSASFVAVIRFTVKSFSHKTSKDVYRDAVLST